MSAKKKKNTLNIAIAAIAVLIVGIVVMIIILTMLYFKDGEKTPEEAEETTTQTEEVTTTEATTTTTVSMTKATTTVPTDEPDATSDQVSTESTTTPPSSYDLNFFERDLFVGDSISTGYSLYGYLPVKNVYALVGMNPESALTVDIDGETLVSRINRMQPRNTYIMLGTNGLAYMGNDYMANAMLNLIAEIEIASPTTNIVFMTIPPVTKAHEAEGNETMALVNDYNDKIKAIAKEGGYTLIDVCALLQDGEGYFSDAYAEQDGLHFLGTAYQRVLSYIQETLGE